MSDKESGKRKSKEEESCLSSEKEGAKRRREAEEICCQERVWEETETCSFKKIAKEIEESLNFILIVLN